MTTDLESLGRSIKRLQHRDHRVLDAALRETGISLVQWDALRAVASVPGSSAHDLAVASFQSDQAFGTLANRLEAADWIDRRSGKGRRIEHYLTPEGREALETGRVTANGIWPQLFAPLDQEQRRTLKALLDLLLDPSLAPVASEEP
jgi:DNA-binding MarR family transcriptional regulator